MSDENTRMRLTASAWVAVLVVSGFLEGDTIATLTRVGLFASRPPLPIFHTVLRILIVVAAVALWYVFQGLLERIALLLAAAAAGSTALYGIGLRSAGLSAFRLLSHLAAYACILLVASRRVTLTFRQLSADVSGHSSP
jgi:hypothetical protein